MGFQHGPAGGQLKVKVRSFIKKLFYNKCKSFLRRSRRTKSRIHIIRHAGRDRDELWNLERITGRAGALATTDRAVVVVMGATINLLCNIDSGGAFLPATDLDIRDNECRGHILHGSTTSATARIT